MRKTIIVEVDSDAWPQMNCMVLDILISETELMSLFKRADFRQSREHQYDVCYPQFEVQVNNILRTAVTDIIKHEKERLQAAQDVAARAIVENSVRRTANKGRAKMRA